MKYYDRRGEEITQSEADQLFKSDGYASVATTNFPEICVSVRTRWMGYSREEVLPARVFLTRAVGDPDVFEITTATEAEALAVHEGLCARYRDQKELIDSGGARLLSKGVL